MSNRSAGTAQISECVAAFTSRHHAAADLFAAAQVRRAESFGDHQIALGIADQVLHDPFRLRVRRLAEVRPEPVVRREPDVVRRRHHHVSDHAGLQAAHPVGEHDLRDPAERLETLRQHRQSGVGAFIVGEAHEPHPRPGQHRAEHMHAGQHAPVDDQRVSRCPDRRPPAAGIPSSP